MKRIKFNQGIPKITPEIFSDAVNKYFDFLVSEYGYVIQPKDPYHFIAEKDDIRLNIFLERDINPIVSVELLGQTAKRVGNWHRADVPIIVDCLYSEADTKMERVGRYTDIDEMRENLEKNATLTKKHLSQILEGDLSRWSEVESCLDESSRKFRERLEKITRK